MQVNRHHTTMVNGIEVVSDTAPHFQSVAIAVSFRIGSVHEPEEKSGASHLLEHVVFRGSETRSGDDFQNAFAEFGGYVNATTDEDSTTFHALALRDDFDDAMMLLAELVSKPLIDAEDVELEKQIVEQENCRGCHNCAMRDAFYDQAFPGQSLRNPIIGYEDTVEALTVEDLRAYHQSAYVGRNLTVAVCGNIEHDAVVRRVGEAFRDLPAGTAAGYPKLSYRPGELQMGDTSDRSAIRIGFPFTDFSLAESRALTIYSDILGGHAQSRLMQELREKRGLVYGAWTHDYDVAGQSLMFVELQGEARKMGEITDIAIDTMREIATDLDEEELARSKKRASAQFRMGMDYISQRCTDLYERIAYRGELGDWNERVEAYVNMSRAEVEAAGQKLLAVDPTIIASGSVRSMPKFDRLRARLRGEAVAEPARHRGILQLIN